MTILSLQEASQAVSVTRQHLYRLAKKGRLSLVDRPNGTKGVDTSELLRIFGRLNAPTEGDATGDRRHGSQVRHEATSSATAVQTVMLEAELASVKAALRVAEERLAEAKDRETKLLDLLTSQTRLLESRQQPTAPPVAPVPVAPVAVQVEEPEPTPKKKTTGDRKAKDTKKDRKKEQKKAARMKAARR